MSARQLGLFGPPPSGGGEVGPAPVAEAHRADALLMPPEVRLGTSSWSFPGWSGIVYDRAATATVLARQGLAAYARHPLLRAVGVDRTFYAPVGAGVLAAMADQVPDDFRFVVKAPALCTAPRQLDGGRYGGPNAMYLDAAFAAEQALAPVVEGLGAKAGALVFQFPPQGSEVRRDPERFAARLGAFLAALPPGPPLAVEIRDRELLTPDYVAALTAAGAVHCLSLHARMPPARPQWEAVCSIPRGLFVARWMLRPDLAYDEARRRYAPFARLVDEDPATRDDLADLCVEASLAGHRVIVVVNNKAEGSAPLSVFRLASRLASLRRSRPGSG